ncbi:MAG: tRNA uridine-5-carboxymethylaminomethyl(34) synthesis enzyme MnmG [Deltaproteobacteria bacterium]|nr:tRNA uridine-5-carboxymethylaminomethyl(34) synthesis enzyme MnmG [Deltaproteobacteria bacterium]
MARFEVIVVGGGHAGIEAALASARLGLATALVTLRAETIGVLSCNPAFGGQAKGGLVREVDALGGWCSRGADLAAIQCRVLGQSKGPATRATRNLGDRAAYSRHAQDFVFSQDNLSVITGEAKDIVCKEARVEGLVLGDGRYLFCGALVLTGGTFWNGRIYNGLASKPGGRFGEEPATLVTKSLASLGHRIIRLSTSTAPRLDKTTVDVSALPAQPGDPEARSFSVLSGPPVNISECFLTYTNAQTHRIVSDNIKTSKIYCDDPAAAGPRYCPSLEDKVRRFPHRSRHQVFLEPDGPDLVYPSGLPTGLAPEVQQALINTIPGLEKTIVARSGYAIEYDVSDPSQLHPTLESRLVKGLFLAGQVNGTSGYEEAASQGLWAGLSAARRASGLEPVRLGRDQALLGVMLDDLSASGVSEPYRMFTSRAEWRLSLREDNADLRLSPLADELGLLDGERRRILKSKQEEMERFGSLLRSKRIAPSMIARKGLLAAGPEGHRPEERLELSAPALASDLLKRPGVSIESLFPLVEGLGEISPSAALSLETEIKYEGYLSRQTGEMQRAAAREGLGLPENLDWRKVPGITGEAAEILASKKPLTLGQAGRLRGVTPAAVSAILVHLRKAGSCEAKA